MAAASCARRSGERFSFLFAFFARLGFFALGVCAERTAVARAADFLAAFNAFAASSRCNFCFSLASFLGPSRRRFSSRWIFFLKFFSFMMCPPTRHDCELIMDLELRTKFHWCHALITTKKSASIGSSNTSAHTISDSRAPSFTNRSGSTQSEPQARSPLRVHYLRCEHRRSRCSYRPDASSRSLDTVGVVSGRRGRQE